MERFIVDLSILMVGAAIFSYLSVLLKQPIIIGYIVCGIVLGPMGIGWIKHAEFIESISHIGITLLLFLAGLCLHPQKLIQSFRETAVVTLSNCGASFFIAFLLAQLFRFGMVDSLCIGLALMFSSTILAVKLLPTTTLHQKKMGAICISVLILEDLLAVLVLVFIRCLGSPQGALFSFGILLVKLVAFIAVLFLIEQFVLRKIMLKIERLQEALFVLGLAWCFGIATISNRMGLLYETGAFFAGVAIARQPISLFISEKLKPLRDFFLVLFFFALGAKLELWIIKEIFWQVLAFSLVFLLFKPWMFKRFFLLMGEESSFAKEIGIRLGQLSEFSLLVALLAFSLGNISHKASQLVQLTAILTFVVSSYIVVLKYPTPIGTTERLRKD
ncbi:MAG: cation:proton antiporter domain-containing protein [Candidatus Omnitrophota bacterium]